MIGFKVEDAVDCTFQPTIGMARTVESELRLVEVRVEL